MKNTLLATLAVFVVLMGISYAEEAAPAKADHSKQIQMHEKMAEAHKNAAQCLKDGKAKDVCSAELKKAMESLKEGCADCKDGNCPMDGAHCKHKGKEGEKHNK